MEFLTGGVSYDVQKIVSCCMLKSIFPSIFKFLQQHV